MPPSPPAAATVEAAAQAAPASLDCLPDSLLGHIMGLVGWEHGRCFMAVSKRWQQVALSEPQLWRRFVVRGYHPLDAPGQRPQRLRRRAALLRRVAPHVATFRWEEHTFQRDPGAEAGIARCLSALSGSPVSDLQLCGECPSLESEVAQAALQELSSVTRLELGTCSEETVAAALAALGSRLRSLQLRTWELSSEVLESTVQLPQLASLHIEAYAWPALDALTRLSQLKQLVLLDCRGGGVDHGMQPPVPASFSAALERFSYEARHGMFQFAGCALFTCRLWPGTALSSNASAEGEAGRQPLPTLALHCAAPVPSLAHLLSALQPAGAAPCAFQRLELTDTLPSDLAACTQLSQLRELSLVYRWTVFDGGALPPTLVALLQHAMSPLAALLQQATGLTALHISSESEETKLRAVPACLASYRGLTSLSLVGQALVELPSGSYLTGLKRLDLSNNAFTRLPAALSTATALTCLTLNGNSELRLRRADKAVLPELPNLQHLEVEGIVAVNPALLRTLQERLPALSVVPMPA